jgi:hypothetical protein
VTNASRALADGLSRRLKNKKKKNKGSARRGITVLLRVVDRDAFHDVGSPTPVLRAVVGTANQSFGWPPKEREDMRSRLLLAILDAVTVWTTRAPAKPPGASGLPGRLCSFPLALWLPVSASPAPARQASVVSSSAGRPAALAERVVRPRHRRRESQVGNFRMRS